MSWAQSLLVPAAAVPAAPAPVSADFFAIDPHRKEVEQRTPLPPPLPLLFHCRERGGGREDGGRGGMRGRLD